MHGGNQEIHLQPLKSGRPVSRLNEGQKSLILQCKITAAYKSKL